MEVTMEGNIVFYIYDKFIELNGRQFSAGELTADLLNLSPEVYRPMHERMARICQLEESFSKSRDLAQWWELNNEMETLCNELRRHTVLVLPTQKKAESRNSPPFLIGITYQDSSSASVLLHSAWHYPWDQGCYRPCH